MLRFFRKMRKALIYDSRFGRYFFYAIGEIVLVVIGILIALSINNWNENNKLIKLEKNLLEEVKIGLESDLERISKSIKDHKKFINSQNIIIDWIDGKYEYNDSLSNHFNMQNFSYQKMLPLNH